MTKEFESPPYGLGQLRVFMRSREASLVLLIAALTAITTVLNPRFLSPQSLKDLMLNVSIIALLVLGQTIIILMRQIDLSISSIVGITAFLSGTLFVNYPGIPGIAVVIVATFAGLLLGAVNASLIAWGKIPALITTLGTLYIFRGANYAWVHGRQINAVNVPGSFLAIGTATFMGVPILTWIVLVLLVVVAIGLRQYGAGREYYAIGSNPNAAVLAGINVSWRIATGFLISGAIAGLAGALWLARFGTVDATAAEGIELGVITSTVVGGVAIKDLVLIRDGKYPPEQKPSRAAGLHRAICRAHPEIQAIINALPLNGTAFCVSDFSLDTRTIPESYLFLKGVVKIPFERQFGDGEEVAAVVGPKNPVALLENNGVLVAGRSVLDAFDRLEVLEATAAAIIRSRALGPISPMGEEVIEELLGAFSGV